MRNFFWILLFLYIMQTCAVNAQESVDLINNLKLKVNTTTVNDYPVIQIENTGAESPIKKNINYAVVKPQEASQELKIPELKIPQNKTQIDKSSSIIPINNEFILSDKVKNLVNDFSSETQETGKIIFNTVIKQLNAINPKKVGAANSYPGYRGPNQLIVYTPAFGLRTGTNEFGTEAIVENNMVVRLNGADSVIPKNGFVISGHGKAKQWISDNICIGSKVYINYSNNSIKVILTPDGLLFAAGEKLKEVTSLTEYYRYYNNSYNDKKAKEYINESKKLIANAQNNPEKSQEYISQAIKSINTALKNTLPYKEGEIKGVWLRPVEKSEEEIEKTIEKLSDAGITDIFLETYFHGKTIYPSEYLKRAGVIYQKEEFAGFDPLEIWIKKAHRKNMKVHIWFETFYAGKDNPQTNQRNVLSVYPSWSNKRLYNYDSTKPVPSLSEHNGYFLDPSNPQVQSYLLGILNEIIDNYKPDGINLDYIRYPQTVEPTCSNYAQMNWGYTENARQEFMYLYGIDPINIKYGTREWDYWDAYRQSQITEFVKAAKKITSDKKILLTAVVFPDLYKSLATKMQNWRIWTMNNYVDGITPLILSGDKNTADILMRDVVRNTTSQTLILPGLFVPFMGGNIDDLLIQIHKTREYKTKGNVLFDFAHLNGKYIDALTMRVYNKSYDTKDVKAKTVQITDEDVKVTKKKKKRRRKNNDGN